MPIPEIIPRYRDRSTPSRWHTERDVERAAHHERNQAVVGATSVEGRAYVARTALLNAALLSREEEQLIQLAPLGQMRYNAIVNAYTMVAVNIVGGM
jgi:hypothetical protein